MIVAHPERVDNDEEQWMLFAGGWAIVEERDDLESTCGSPHVEAGERNYSCVTPELWHRISNKLPGGLDGPAWYQRQDIAKTIKVIERNCGKRITIWRNHMYMHGPDAEGCPTTQFGDANGGRADA